MDDFFNPGEPAAAPGKCIFVFHTKTPQFFSEMVFLYENRKKLRKM